MDDYLNKNYVDIIRELIIKKETSKATGRPYYCFDLKFINGYERRIFLNNDQLFAMTDACRQIEE